MPVVLAVTVKYLVGSDNDLGTAYADIPFLYICANNGRWLIRLKLKVFEWYSLTCVAQINLLVIETAVSWKKPVEHFLVAGCSVDDPI